MSQPHIAAKTVSVKLDADIRTRIENLAEAHHHSAHWVMREAISQYVDREEKREAFRQDTIKAWEEYKETGLHASALEVDTWLASWGTDNELPAPPMPQVIYSPAAIGYLQRLREFLPPKNSFAAKRAAETIMKAVHVIGLQPQIGRPIEDMPENYREWPIDFGDSGYIARYQLNGEVVTILAVRHQKEVDY